VEKAHRPRGARRRGFRGLCLRARVIVPINQRRYSSKGPMPHVLIGPRSYSHATAAATASVETRLFL